MSISDGLMEVADMRIPNLNGTPGIGFHRLQFSLEIQLRATRGRIVQLGDLTAFAYAATSQAASTKPLARAVAETSWWTHTTEDARREFLSLYIDLTSEQLEALEQMRGGGPLWFQFDLRVLVRSEAQGTQRGFEKLGFEATLSDWARVLGQLGYLELLVVAIEMPVGVPQEFRNAVEQLRAAHQDLIAGRYDATVGRCRIAMDAMEAVVGYESAIADVRQAFASKSDRADMTKRSRADLVRLAVRHYTHLAHHVDGAGAPESFSRQDALFILSAASGTLLDATAERRKRVKE
jgi:hypothetical protein